MKNFVINLIKKAALSAIDSRYPTFVTTAMVKRKRSAIAASKETDPSDVVFHVFNEDATSELRKCLLQWYDENKRDLPWREMVKLEDENRRGYADWVSEIMLQQTQVATVISYYNKWMKKWPTLQDLAAASLEEVNEMWSGLGYYSRAKRLHDGAQKVVNELGGEMPRTAEDLLNKLPGVGRYTAGAIASIAFGERSGVVDGNVIRVFSRMRLVGADSTSQHVVEHFWNLANGTVDPDRPGDYNQALMELGATVCTPKSPQCAICPVQTLCKAYSKVQREKSMNSAKLVQSLKSKKTNGEIPDIECAADSCKLCLPDDESWDSSTGVQNLPRKGKKKESREEKTLVCIFESKKNHNHLEYMIVQRPAKGLLAGLWEFPSSLIDTTLSEDGYKAEMEKYLKNSLSVTTPDTWKINFVGEVSHIFSHINQTYVIFSVTLPEDDDVEINTSQLSKWVTKEKFLDSAISTAMKKVFKKYEEKDKLTSKKTQGKKDGKKQLALDSFFKPKAKS